MHFSMDLSYVLVLSACYQVIYAVDSTCKLTNVLFRHGDRSPMRAVPSDLHTESAWAQGYGQLTQLGIQQAYELGHFLRSWYNGFLSQQYVREEVYIESTDTARTLMSAQSVLSSLYLPSGLQEWQQGFPWQPVPIHPSTWEKVRSKLDRECRDEIVKHAKAKIAKDFRKKYKEVFDEIEKGMDTKLHSVGMLWTIYDTFMCEYTHNLTLPSWMSERLLNRMREILPYHHKAIFSLSPDRADLLSKMIGKMSEIVHGVAKEKRKALIYSGHDTNILCLLCAMNVYNLRMSPYSTAIMVELHYGEWKKDSQEDTDNDKEKKNNEPVPNFVPENDNERNITDTYYTTNNTADLNETVTFSTVAATTATTEGIRAAYRIASDKRWFVQVWLRNDTQRAPYKLTLPGCTSDCPWERFLELTLPAVIDLHQNLSLCSSTKDKLPNYRKYWRVILVTVGAGGIVMLIIVMFSAICLFRHRKRQQRLQAIYRQLNTEDIPMAYTS